MTRTFIGRWCIRSIRCWPCRGGGAGLIAGDAAHLMPPFLGQGLCSGIRDVRNLAWKLRAVLAGAAGEELLDTYESERSPHCREYVELSTRVGEIVDTIDPAVAADRDRRMLAGETIESSDRALRLWVRGCMGR